MEIKDRVRQFITENFYVADASKLTDEASLLDQGIIDSTGVLELVGFLEGEYGIQLADEEIVAENLDSIANIVGLVGRKKAGAA